MVSIVIPSFNRAKYIEKAVQSALDQTYDITEIIVVDDGSTDGSYVCLASMELAGKIKLLHHNDHLNRGQSCSINLGIKNSKGEFIVVLDSDDYLAPHSIARHAHFLKNNPEVGLVYGNGCAVDSEGEPLGYNTLSPEHKETGDPNNLLLNCYIALPGGSMVRANLYKKVGWYEESLRAGQDHDMALRLFEASDVQYIPEIAFFYRKHPETISVNGLEKRWKAGFFILQRAKSRYPYRSAIVRRRAAVLNFRLGMELFKKGKFFNSLVLLFKSAALDPIRACKVMMGMEKIR